MLRKNMGVGLYVLAIVLTLTGTIFVMFIHRGLLIEGKGIGSFGVVVVGEYVAVSIVLWLGALFLARHKRLDVIFWLLTAIPIAMLFVVPINFYIE